MGKPSISMGFENRTTCCMPTPPHPPVLSSLPLTSPFPEPFAHPPLDTRADSFPRERCLRTVPNAFPFSDPGTRPSSLFTLNRPTDIPLFDVIACTRITRPRKKKKKEKENERRSAKYTPLHEYFSSRKLSFRIFTRLSAIMNFCL